LVGLDAGVDLGGGIEGLAQVMQRLHPSLEAGDHHRAAGAFQARPQLQINISGIADDDGQSCLGGLGHGVYDLAKGGDLMAVPAIALEGRQRAHQAGV
jgi:hypothetical protein